MAKKILSVILVLVLIIGTGVLLYPIVSNYISRNGQARAIQQFHESVDAKTQEELEQMWKAAQEYNDKLAGSLISDPFTPGMGDEDLSQEYQQVLNPEGNGIMGRVFIPKIDVDLPIAHGTSEKILANSVGHVENTSLPIGGEGNHSVLSGHRGLPEAKLFTALDDLEEGDVFYLEILDKTLAYEVDQISVVEPGDPSKLAREEGEDYVTLLTCTPYGINSHRLLVRGQRIPYTDTEAKEACTKAEEERKGDVGYVLRVYGWVFAVVLILMIVVALIARRRKRK